VVSNHARGEVNICLRSLGTGLRKTDHSSKSRKQMLTERIQKSGERKSFGRIGNTADCCFDLRSSRDRHIIVDGRELRLMGSCPAVCCLCGILQKFFYYRLHYTYTIISILMGYSSKSSLSTSQEFPLL
jgi:hypothetical protein